MITKFAVNRTIFVANSLLQELMAIIYKLQPLSKKYAHPKVHNKRCSAPTTPHNVNKLTKKFTKC